jgi:predicted transcriptional regulator
MTQVTLAARAGISSKYVGDLEAGRYDPTVGVMRRIARALKIPLCELLG